LGTPGLTSNSPKQAWSQNKNERHALLQKRRDEMILAARKKMEEKDQAARAHGAS
jgi:coupling of ubiquitin conjugation to ER degradation protein 1